ncbi:MAG: hypothetical protein ABJL44_00525 [Algibacter sp.]
MDVIESMKNVETFGIFAVNHEGTVYVVTEVLSVSKANDLTNLKLETHGEKLKALL